MRKGPGTCIFEDSCVLAAGELWLKRRAAMTSQLLMTVHTSSAHSGHRGPSGGGQLLSPIVGYGGSVRGKSEDRHPVTESPSLRPCSPPSWSISA